MKTFTAIGVAAMMALGVIGCSGEADVDVDGDTTGTSMDTTGMGGATGTTTGMDTTMGGTTGMDTTMGVIGTDTTMGDTGTSTTP